MKWLNFKPALFITRCDILHVAMRISTVVISYESTVCDISSIKDQIKFAADHLDSTCWLRHFLVAHLRLLIAMHTDAQAENFQTKSKFVGATVGAKKPQSH